MRRVLVVATNTFRETVRERVLFGLVLFAILMTLAALLLRELSIRQDEKMIKDMGLAAMDIFASLIAILVGVQLVSKEIERRSVYPVLAKPVGRDEFLLGKFAGLGLTVLVNAAAMAAGLFLTLWVTGRTADAALLKAVYGILLASLLTVAVALMFSTVTSSTLAAVLTVCVVVAGRFSDVIRNMLNVMPEAPRWLVRGLYLAVPNFANFDLKDRVVYGDPVTAAELVWIGAYAAAYTGVLLGLAAWSFRSRDL